MPNQPVRPGLAESWPAFGRMLLRWSPFALGAALPFVVAGWWLW